MSPATLSLTDAHEQEDEAPPVLCDLADALAERLEDMDDIDWPRADYVIRLVDEGATRKSWDFAITTAREIIARVDRRLGVIA